jgi:hypothetical protein
LRVISKDAHAAHSDQRERIFEVLHSTKLSSRCAIGAVKLNVHDANWRARARLTAWDDGQSTNNPSRPNLDEVMKIVKRVVAESSRGKENAVARLVSNTDKVPLAERGHELRLKRITPITMTEIPNRIDKDELIPGRATRLSCGSRDVEVTHASRTPTSCS